MSSRCQKPIMIRNLSVTRGAVQAPCGRCENCLKRRVSNWSFRLMQHAKTSSSAYFVTLTYDTSSVHITKNGFMGLKMDDVQRFFKRIRKAHEQFDAQLRVQTGRDFRRSLKYYAVGEYGGKGNRPHYHIILFNAELSLLIGEKYSSYFRRGLIELNGKDEYHCPYWGYASKVITVYGTKQIRSIIPARTIGHITVGHVTEASVGYTMKYISKPSKIPMHRNDDRLPEFSISSQGLGKCYLTGQMIAWHKADLEKRQYCNLADGKKVSMPRYYKKFLLDLQETENLRAWNILEAMKEKPPEENTSLERSEAYYAGLKRSKLNHIKNQKL